jgi:synaptobrevin family protein YKT6
VYARSEGVCGVIISDEAYPSLVAHQVLGRLLDTFLSEHPVAALQTGNKVHFPQAKEYLQKYQDPQQAGKRFRAKQEWSC